jgi:ribosomal-protein-alanine N-acetyltransferase
MMRIRPFVEGDLRAVLRVSEESLTEEYSPILFLEIREALPDAFLVAEVDGSVVGYICGYPLTAFEVRIAMFAVLPGYRGKGIGSALYAEFERVARKRGFRIMRLEVRTGNRRAVEFYRRRGFMVVKVLKGYYRNGDDAYVMVKTL